MNATDYEYIVRDTYGSSCGPEVVHSKLVEKYLSTTLKLEFFVLELTFEIPMMGTILLLLFPDLSIVRYQTVNRISNHKNKLK